jgi:antitoxin VapB
MPLSIKAPEADRLARQLASVTGETITEAVIVSMRERLRRETNLREDKRQLVEDLMAIGRHCASLPVYDNRSADEILGWDENGLPS